MSYEPKFGRVIIKREIKKQTSGGIIIPEAAAKRNASCRGEIISLGETAGWTSSYNENGEEIVVRVFKPGQRVVFGRHSGAWLDATYTEKGENDDGTLFICQDTDILAVIN